MTSVESKCIQCIDCDRRGYKQLNELIQNYGMKVCANYHAELIDHPRIESAHVHSTSMDDMAVNFLKGNKDLTAVLS